VDKPVFSVIVPVYNIEEYLKECVGSILAQREVPLELILVDDGSTDGSPAMCDAFAKEDVRVRVVHQKNGRAAAARNAGLRCAKGDYVLFVDGDDWIEPSVILTLHHSIQRRAVDLIFLEAVKAFPDGSQQSFADGYKKELIDGKQRGEVLNHIASLEKFPGSACTKLARMDMIRREQLYFLEGTTGEDVDWVARALLCAETFAYCSETYYFYRQNRPGSVTHRPGESNFVDLLRIVERWSDPYLTTRPGQELLNDFMAYEFSVAMALYGGLPKEARKKYRLRMRELKWLLQDGRTKKIKLVNGVQTILGQELACRVLAWYVRTR